MIPVLKTNSAEVTSGFKIDFTVNFVIIFLHGYRKQQHLPNVINTRLTGVIATLFDTGLRRHLTKN